MVENVGAARDALGDVVENITLGNVEVPPLPRGEPSGRVSVKVKTSAAYSGSHGSATVSLTVG